MQRVASAVGWCVSVGHNHEPYKNGSTDCDAVWVVDSGGPLNHVLGAGGRSPMETGNFGGFPAHCKAWWDQQQRQNSYIQPIYPLTALAGDGMDLTQWCVSKFVGQHLTRGEVCLVVYPMHWNWIRLFNHFFCLCPCVSRSVVEWLCLQFVDFCQILRAARKCGKFNACCLWENGSRYPILEVCKFQFW